MDKTVEFIAYLLVHLIDGQDLTEDDLAIGRREDGPSRLVCILRPIAEYLPQNGGRLITSLKARLAFCSPDGATHGKYVGKYAAVVDLRLQQLTHHQHPGRRLDHRFLR